MFIFGNYQNDTLALKLQDYVEDCYKHVPNIIDLKLYFINMDDN